MQRCIVLCLGLMCGSVAETNEPNAYKTVTFVCEHGVAKSVIAAAYFNQRAKEKGLRYRAVSRGTSPDQTTHAATVAGLAQDGLDTNGFVPTEITVLDEQRSAFVVTIGIDEEPLFLRTRKLIEWDGVPSVSANYELARDDLRRRIEELIVELQKND